MAIARGLNVPERPLVGTLWITPDGLTYKLADYRLDMANTGPNGEDLYLPSYQVMLEHKGGFTNAYALPDDVVCVYLPEEVRQIRYVGDSDPWVGFCARCDYQTGKGSQNSATKALSDHKAAKHGGKN